MNLTDAFYTEFLAKLLAELGVHTAKGVLASQRKGSSGEDREPVGQPKDDLAYFQSSGIFGGIDPGESPRFLARQRFYHRRDLAKAKWDWLVLSTYFHPTKGIPGAVAAEWLPRSIGGQFVTADFAERDLPFEGEIGESSPSQIRISGV